jgi:WD40 repeat protein
MEADASVSVFSHEGVREFTYQLGRISEQIALQGDFLAVAEVSEIAIVDVQKGRLLHSLEPLSGDVTALAFQPGSDVLWIAHDHYTHRGTLRRIHVRQGSVGLARSLDFEPQRLSVARDGSVGAAAYGIVEIHRARGDKAECLYSESGVDNVFLSEEGQWLVTWSSREIRIRKGFTNAPLFVVSTQISIANVALSFDERILYCASRSGVVMIIDLQARKHVATLARVMNGLIGIRPDGRYRATGDVGGRFGHTIGLCRFEPGELEPYVSLAIPEGEPLIAWE